MIKHLAVAYYPEHCDEARWPRDIALMQQYGIDSVRILEFAWSRLERADAQWDFAWAHRALRLFEDAGLGVVLCTPSAAPPAWLTGRFPETLCLKPNGQRDAHGTRRQSCPTSRRYRDFCNRIAGQMQDELGGYPNILAWQIDNELGFNRCYCDECKAAFRESLRARFGTLENLNRAMGGAFWSQDFWEWEQVGLPHPTSPSPEMRLAFDRFYSDQLIGFMGEQVETLRDAGAKTPISTNLMADFPEIDLWKITAPLDFVGWDNYADQYTLAGNSLAHHLMRSLKGGAGYWTFENGVNSVSPWLQSAPGANTVHALSALAHGEIGHTFWRWDSCPFGHEQDLQGLVDWAGNPRAKLREVGQLRAILDEVTGLELPPLQPRIALIFSQANYWGTHPYYGRAYYDGAAYKSYWPEIESFYQAIFDWGLGCDCVPPDGDLSGYDLILAPGLCLVSDAEIESLRSYVEGGGVLLAGRKTFVKTPDNTYRTDQNPALSDVFGMRVSESQSNEDGNDITVRAAAQPRPFRTFHLESESELPPTATTGWFETLELHGARALYRYSDGFFAGEAAASVHEWGSGQAWYLGARIERDTMKKLMRQVLQAAKIDPVCDVPQGAQCVQRGEVSMLTNHTGQTLTVCFSGAVRGMFGAALTGQRLDLPPFGFAVVQKS